MTDTSKPHRRRVRFSLNAGEGRKVYLAGTFNDWSPKRHPMTFKDGSYSAQVLLSPGHYEYKFIIDGDWCVDPECLSWTFNQHGTLNSVIDVD
jgi:1,4-alpha-glucan branching enzyme